MNGKIINRTLFNTLLSSSVMMTSIFAESDYGSDQSTTSGSIREITPPAGFAAEQGIGFSVYADFIYWEARETNLTYAISSARTASVTADTLVRGNGYFPSFNYKPGFKAGIAFDLGHDNWDLDINYTWLNGSGSKSSVTDTTPYTLITTQGTEQGNISFSLNQADSNWFFQHNLINMNLGRDYFISQYLSLRPYFGLSGAWNRQKQTIHYHINNQFVTDTNIHNSQSFWGVGFCTGLQTGWAFDENWSIFGNFGMMNLWSKYNVNHKELNVVYESTSELYTNVQYGIQNVLDLELGLRWYKKFDDDTMGVLIQAGWEQQLWINHSQMIQGVSSNLSLQGLTTRFRLDF